VARIEVAGSGFAPVGPGDGWRWQASERPAVLSIPLAADVAAWDGLGRLGPVRSGPVQVRSVDLAMPAPRVASVPIARDPRPRVRSFTFAESVEQEGPLAAPASARRLNTGSLGTTTRIRPPRDVIKLEDRLHYVLQPSLEALLVERALGFPFAPFPYQCEGVAFLYPRHAAILADEMGLGKTMQAITTIRLLLHRREIRRVLVVCPKPLVTNWRRELAEWAPEVPVTVIEGDGARRRWQWSLADAPIRIANYELLHRDRDDFGAPGAMQFDLVVLDEAQRIKNRHSATSQAVRALPSGRRWALTGTPVENSSEDLVGIFEFLAPGFLSPELRPGRMGRTVRDYVLRRTKEQVLVDLPPKLVRDAELTLSPEQQSAYDVAESEGIVHLSALGGQVTIRHVFELILRLKQICNFDPVTEASSKCERLEADLEEVAQSGRKALVFSQWVGTLARLRRRRARFGPLEYHGQIAPRARDEVVRRFRDDPGAHVLLISYGAGSVGLNLQMAGYVFLFDRWWNPAVEDQAINRVHRIGTAGPVTVTRLLMLGTIEERISRILEEKRELFDTILGGAGARRLGLSQEELFGLFDLARPANPLGKAA